MKQDESRGVDWTAFTEEEVDAIDTLPPIGQVCRFCCAQTANKKYEYQGLQESQGCPTRWMHCQFQSNGPRSIGRSTRSLGPFIDHFRTFATVRL